MSSKKFQGDATISGQIPQPYSSGVSRVPEPSIFTGFLHNYTIFAVQRYFYNQAYLS
jgi:hypothetical protein